METQAYVQGRVWQNGLLKEDMEMYGQERDGNVSLVIREKDDVRSMSVPTDLLLASVFRPEVSGLPLHTRIEELIPRQSTRRSSSRSNKSKRASGTRKRVKRTARKTKRSTRK
jgi:hypothetical protein